MLIFPVCCCLSDGPPGHAPLSSHGNAPHGAETPQHAAGSARHDAADDAPHGRTADGAGKAAPPRSCPSFVQGTPAVGESCTGARKGSGS